MKTHLSRKVVVKYCPGCNRPVKNKDLILVAEECEAHKTPQAFVRVGRIFISKEDINNVRGMFKPPVLFGRII